MIQVWIVSFSLILTRVGTFVSILPVLGGQNLPRTVKLGLSMALSVQWFVTFGLVPSQEVVAGLSQAQWLPYGLALGREAILGAVLGYAFGLFLVPMRIAGEFLSQEMGLTIAGQLDPTSTQPAGTMTQIFEMLGTLIFLGLDGHHLFLAALHSTFVRWPIGGGWPALPVEDLVRGAGLAEEWGVLLAAPVVICLFLTSVVLALLARAAPQMNIFSIGFALRLGVGLAATFVLMPEIVSVMVSILGQFSELMVGWI